VCRLPNCARAKKREFDVSSGLKWLEHFSRIGMTSIGQCAIEITKTSGRTRDETP